MCVQWIGMYFWTAVRFFLIMSLVTGNLCAIQSDICHCDVLVCWQVATLTSRMTTSPALIRSSRLATSCRRVWSMSSRPSSTANPSKTSTPSTGTNTYVDQHFYAFTVMSVGMYVDYLLLVLPFCVGVNTDRIKTRKNASKPDIAQMALNLLFLALGIDFGSKKARFFAHI